VFIIGAEGAEHVLRPCRRVKLLAVLVLNAGSTVSTERLMAELWDGSAPDAARNALHAQVVRLRRDLESWTGPDGPTLHTAFPGYRLDLRGADLDVLRFRALAVQAHDLRDRDPRASLDLARRALGLWRGTAFTGLSLGPVAEAAKARLEESRFSLRLDALQLALDLGEHRDVVPELQELVVRHPCCEQLYRLLMIALYRSGRFGEALRAYETARQVFTRDLGVDPSPDLGNLLTDMLRHDPALRTPSPRHLHHAA
jgi:DNA-binding SARP family transcriptional activator